MFRYDRKKVASGERLGGGTFGNVYPYQKDPNDHKWVVKIMSLRTFEDFVSTMQEVVLGFNLDHPSIVPVRGYHAEENPNGEYDLRIKLPRMKQSLSVPMQKAKKSKQSIPENQIVRWFYDVVCGLEYLHERRIALMDIKPDNILLDDKNNAKLADIGLAKFTLEGETLKSVVSGYGGTPAYWAPEVGTGMVLKRKDLYCSDAWSLGITIINLCIPNMKFIDAKASSQEVNEKIRGLLATIRQQNYSQDLEETIASLLKYKEQERMTMEKLRKILEEKFSAILVPLLWLKACSFKLLL